jgi:hypothetical protein
MEALDIVGWVFYALLFWGLFRLAVPRDRGHSGLERLDYRR